MAGSTKRVLIVDDEVEFLSMLKSTLELRGMDVVTADNGIAAGMAISSRPPDLILMDINMPGINGLQACAAIRKNPATKDIPVIVISATTVESVVSQVLRLGVSDFFPKPVDIEKLITRIRFILES